MNFGQRMRAAEPWAIAALIFLVAYLPFALSGAYPPSIYGTMGRVNGMGAWAWAVAMALMLRRGGWPAVGAAWLLVFSFCSARILGAGWLRAAREQRRILAKVEHLYEQGRREFYLPRKLWDPTSGAPIFEEDWDWPYAVRYVTRDQAAAGKFER